MEWEPDLDHGDAVAEVGDEFIGDGHVMRHDGEVQRVRSLLALERPASLRLHDVSDGQDVNFRVTGGQRKRCHVRLSDNAQSLGTKS